MLDIKIRQHVLKRWPERIGSEISEDYIQKLFRGHTYGIIEPAKKGRLIVNLAGYVFVITRTNTSIIVHTIYGKYEDYELKRPDCPDTFTQFEIDRWERHQYRRKVKAKKRG